MQPNTRVKLDVVSFLPRLKAKIRKLVFRSSTVLPSFLFQCIPLSWTWKWIRYLTPDIKTRFGTLYLEHTEWVYRQLGPFSYIGSKFVDLTILILPYKSILSLLFLVWRIYMRNVWEDRPFLEHALPSCASYFLILSVFVLFLTHHR